MYGETLAHALQMNRPKAEVVSAEPGDLDGALESFGPRLVVCNEATERVKTLVPSWVVLTYLKAVEADVCLGGRRSTIKDVGVADMLAVMDEAERLSAEAT